VSKVEWSSRMGLSGLGASLLGNANLVSFKLLFGRCTLLLHRVPPSANLNSMHLPDGSGTIRPCLHNPTLADPRPQTHERPILVFPQGRLPDFPYHANLLNSILFVD